MSDLTHQLYCLNVHTLARTDSLLVLCCVEKRADMTLKQQMTAASTTAAVRGEMPMAETSQFSANSDGGILVEEQVSCEVERTATP